MVDSVTPVKSDQRNIEATGEQTDEGDALISPLVDFALIASLTLTIALGAGVFLLV